MVISDIGANGAFACVNSGTSYIKGASASYNQQTVTGYTPNGWFYGANEIIINKTDWSDLTKDAQPALLNVVIGSTEDHVPQLVYGWDGKHGNKVAIPNAGGSAWNLETIPDEGVIHDYFAADGRTNAVFVVSDNHVLSLDKYIVPSEPSGPFFLDGVQVYSDEAPDGRYLGIVSLIARNGANYAPIRCDTYNSLWNAENQTEQFIYRQPRAGYGYALTGGINDHWSKFRTYGNPPQPENEEWTAKILTGEGTVCHIAAKDLGSLDGAGAHVGYSFGVDTKVPRVPAVIQEVAHYVSVERTLPLPEGLHDVFPLNNCNYGTGNEVRCMQVYGDMCLQIMRLEIEYMG